MGVMFLGKNPPRGYDQHPAGRFLLPSDSAGKKPANACRAKRHQLAINIKLSSASGAGTA